MKGYQFSEDLFKMGSRSIKRIDNYDKPEKCVLPRENIDTRYSQVVLVKAATLVKAQQLLNSAKDDFWRQYWRMFYDYQERHIESEH